VLPNSARYYRQRNGGCCGYGRLYRHHVQAGGYKMADVRVRSACNVTLGSFKRPDDRAPILPSGGVWRPWARRWPGKHQAVTAASRGRAQAAACCWRANACGVEIEGDGDAAATGLVFGCIEG